MIRETHNATHTNTVETRTPQNPKSLWGWMTVVFLTLLLTACGKNAAPADSGRQVWVPEFLPLEMEEDSYNSIAFLGDAFYYISYEQQAQGFRYRLSGYSLADGPLPSVPLNWPDDRDRFVTSLFAMDGEGCFYLLAFVTEEEGSATHLCKFDAEGNPVYDTDISGETDNADLLTVDSQGRACLSGSVSGAPCVWLYASDGTFSGTFSPDVPNGKISAMGLGRDGAVYACCHGNSGGGDNYFLMEIDIDAGKAGASCPDFPKGDNTVLVPGMENTLLSYDRTALSSYDLTSRTGQVLFDWLDYGINGSRVEAVHVQEDGRLLVVIRDLAEGSGELALLKKADSPDAARKETILLGTIYSNSLLRNAVMEFNRENQNYQVKIKEYLDPVTHDQADAALRLNSDILSDNCPDILDISELDLKALASKGLFADLNSFLENSSLLNASDFPDNLLGAYTVDNKLITIPSCFSLKTVFGWSEATGGTWGWTLEELISYADAHPQAEIFANATRGEIMQYLMSYNEDAFIDWSSGECRFDSDAFRELLAFVSRFPGEAAPNPEQASTPVRIRNGEVLLLAENITEFNSIQLPLAIYGNEGACVGFPSADGSAGCMLIPYGACAITEKSARKDGAWAFIEKLLTSGDRDSVFFPSQKSRLAEKAAGAVNTEDPDGENGEMWAVSYSDWEYTYHIPSREEVDMTLKLIEAAKPVSFSDADEVTAIINEEAEDYYLGQKTLDEVVEIIQSRVFLYVNED